jgi:hypothetical protein
VRTVVAPDLESTRDALADDIAALRRKDPLTPILVVAPSDLAREETRRFLARRLCGTLGVLTLSLGEWVRELAKPEIERRGGKLLSEPAFDRLVARVIELELAAGKDKRSARYGSLVGAADTPGLTALLRATSEDLLEAGFEPQHLAQIRDAAHDPLRAELARFFDALCTELRGRAFYDRRLQERLATEVLADCSAAGTTLPVTYFYGFHDLTALQRSLVAAAARSGPISLFVPGGPGAGEAAAAPLLQWVQENGSAFEVLRGDASSLLTLAEPLFDPPHLVDPGPEALEMRTYANESAEVRGIARRIRRDVRCKGRRFCDFLVVVPAGGPSPLLFRRIFERAAVPLTDRAGVPAAKCLRGRRALALARVLAASEEERIVEALSFLAATRPEADRSDERATRARCDVAGADFASAPNWGSAARLFHEQHEAVFAEPVPAFVEECLLALEAVLDPITFSPGGFVRSLAGALQRLRETAEPAGEEDEGSVLLLRIDQARGIVRPVVFYAGLTEGAYLRTPREDPLLPDYLREGLNEHHERFGRYLPLKGESGPEGVLLARFAFACANERALLSWSRRQRTGGELRNPSGLLLDVAAVRAGQSLAPDSPEFLAQAPLPDPRESQRDPVDRTDLELSLLLGERPPREKELARLLADPRGRFLPLALRAAEERWQSGRLGGHDAVLQCDEAKHAVRRRLAKDSPAWSPTALETILDCPFAFLVRQVLGLEPAREEQDDLEPLERGSIFHAIVEEVYRELAARGELPLTEEILPGALSHLAECVKRWRVRADGERPAQRLQRRATLALLHDDIALLLAREACQPETAKDKPIHFELRFGPNAAGEGPVCDLAEHGAVPLRGTIDRIDLEPDGRIKVIEYKTGARRARAGKITAGTGVKPSVYLQLPLYLDAAATLLRRRPDRAIFYHATAEHGFREVPFTAGDLERARPAIRRLMRRAVACAQGGWFPSLPGAACCRADLESACGPSAAARFRRKQEDPDVLEHFALLRSADASGQDETGKEGDDA